MKICFTDYASRDWLPHCPKLAQNWKNYNDVKICRYDVIVNFFYIKFSYWFKFHVNIITGSVVMTSFLYKGLTRNPEIGNTPVWVLPNIWRLRRVRDTKFGTNVSKKLLLKFPPIQDRVKSVKGRRFQSF